MVGEDRTQTWEDEENLPYLKAVVSETLRVRSEVELMICLFKACCW